MTQSFYKRSDGIVLTFDVTNLESYNHVNKWMTSIETHADSSICKILVGNKVDMVDNRVVTQKEASELAAKYKMKYFEASAKLNQGVQDFF